MKDTISIESINAVRSRLLEKAGKNPLQLVTVTDKNGHQVRRWKNMLTDQEIPEEHWTPEMKETAKRETERLLAAGPKATSNSPKVASREEIERIKAKAEGKPKKQTVKEKAINEKTKVRKFEAKRIEAANNTSDEDILKLAHGSAGDRARLNEIVSLRAKSIFDKMTNSSKWLRALSVQDREDVFQNVVVKLLGGQKRKNGENKGQNFEHVATTFESGKAAREAKGKTLNFEQHLVVQLGRALLTALQQQQHHNLTFESLDNGSGAEPDEAKESARQAEKTMGSDESMNADAEMADVETLGAMRADLLKGLNSPNITQPERLVQLAFLRGKSMEEIGKWFFSQSDNPTKVATRVYQDGLMKMREGMNVVKEGGTGRGTHYKFANGKARPDFDKAYSEFLFNLEKSVFLQTLEK